MGVGGPYLAGAYAVVLVALFALVVVIGMRSARTGRRASALSRRADAPPPAEPRPAPPAEAPATSPAPTRTPTR